MPNAGKTLSFAEFMKRLWLGLSLVDGLTLCFFGYFLLRFSLVPDSPETRRALSGFTTLMVLFCLVLVLVRGQLMSRSPLRGVVYRTTLFVVHAVAFIFFFRDALVCLQPVLLDPQLAAIDRFLFGVVPAVWSAQFNSVWLTEYLSFFYLTHFLVVIYAVGPTLVTGRRDPAAIAMTTGSLILIVAGWVIYTLVPAMGPYQTLSFPHPIGGGVFFNATMNAVDHTGPLLDVFPSLHSAFTFFVALQLSVHARTGFSRCLAPILFFVDFNIILATIYLRFHYVIDVMAGLFLAWLVHRISLGYTRRIMDSDRTHRIQPVFADPLADES